ncbi:MAG: LPXTG-motif cell wall anchor domain protein [Candidatus Curtissbacteria bacterium GW2011_GWA1_40_16]|uniref:LPXTG-motif cell wall anchor domain protein n=1 Tax=Candidatus Curtissbacteria bacterium GW2011_GWA1_40_16 TaxID=1618405 RepID=A0A0G0R7M6_9BACT|nr:MAG: LPXTG-motif cell wall anchor domain protein [Candidatus Curtissbacteria bacterium GW2011_GWA1_40_16]
MDYTIKGEARRIVTSLTMATTVLLSVGFAAMPIATLAVAPADYGLQEGNTISASGSSDPDIYIVNDWGYKRLFVNPAIFTLYGHLSWAGVKAVAPATRDAFGTSGLFRNCETGDQKVYGLDVVSEDVANLRWVNTTGAQAVADDANFFKKVFCINTREQALYGTGADYTSVTQVPIYTRGTLPPSTGAVAAYLASDNPAANTLIETQAAADLAHFTFTGSGTVTSVVLNRLGVSSDTTLTNVYLYSGAKRLTDAATVSSGKITFSDLAGLFTVSGSTTISVKADIANSTTGQTVGVSLTSFNGNAVSLSGNLFSIAVDPSDFGTITVGAPTPTTADDNLSPQTDFVMWQSTVTVGNHDAWLKSLQLRVIGSVQVGDLRNFRLTVDGAAVGSAIAQTDANGYLVFDFGSGVKLTAGSRIVKLVGDIIGGSTRTFVVSLRQKSDISLYESQYGVGILPTITTVPATAPTTGDHDIDEGSVTITKATDSNSGDVVKDATSVSLVKYKFEAFGESLKFETLRASFTASLPEMASLRNAGIYADGVQIGSLASLCEDTVSTTASCSAGTAYTEFSLGSSLVVVPGTPRIVEVRADIYDNTGTNNATAEATIIAQIIAGNSNVQRLTSLGYFSNTAGAVGSTLTIKTGSFTVSKYTGYANQSVVSPKTQYKIGQFNLTAATSEDVNVNTLVVDAQIAVFGSHSATDLTNMFLKVYDDTGALRLSTTPKNTVSGTASNSYSVNFTIPATKVWQVEVYGDISSGLDSDDTIITSLDATGLTVSSATSATATGATGQTISGASGALNLNNGTIPASRIINGGQQAAVYSFSLQPQYDDYTLDDVVFKLSGTVASSANAVATAYLKEGSTLIGTAPAIANTSSISISFTGVNRPITQIGGTKIYTLEIKYANVGVGANDTAGLVLAQLSHLKYRNSAGTITTSLVTPASYQSNNNYVVSGYPTIALGNLTASSTTNATLGTGTQTLAKVAITSNGNPISWRKVVFAITTTAIPTLDTFQLFENGSEISTAASQSLGGNNTMLYYATNSKAFSVAGVGNGTVTFMFNTDRVISGTTTLELKANIGGALVAGQSVTTKIDNSSGSTFVAPSTVIGLGGAVAGGWNTDVIPSFLWTDNSSPSHSGTTDDWFGDALLGGINQSQSLSL